jgi:hypothetical protein
MFPQLCPPPVIPFLFPFNLSLFFYFRSASLPLCFLFPSPPSILTFRPLSLPLFPPFHFLIRFPPPLYSDTPLHFIFSISYSFPRTTLPIPHSTFSTNTLPSKITSYSSFLRPLSSTVFCPLINSILFHSMPLLRLRFPLASPSRNFSPAPRLVSPASSLTDMQVRKENVRFI